MEARTGIVWMKRIGRRALLLWAVLATVVGASLMATHTFALPRPSSLDPALSRALSLNSVARERGRWRMVHVMYSRCRCSQRILGHLLARRALPEAAERLVLVGANETYERAATEAGFLVQVVTAEELSARWAMSAAPSLIIAAPDGSVAYLGGYSARKQGLELRDRELFASARAGGRARELPLFGCAVSAALRDRIDPFGLKSPYWERSDGP